MGGVFGRKSLEERFREAVKKGDASAVVKLGKELLKKSGDGSLLSEVINGFLSVGKREEAESILVSRGRRLIRDGYYDSAVILLKKAVKLNGFNLDAVLLLSEAYRKKGLAYDSFRVVEELFNRLRSVGELSPRVKEAYLESLKYLLDTAEELKSGNVDNLLAFFSDLAKEILGADRCSLFLYDPEREVLWTKVAHGVDRIEVPVDKGIVGKVFREGKPLSVSDAHSSPYFNPEVDKETGYYTRSVLAVPVLSPTGRVIGVYQAINKKKGVFSQVDLEIFTFLSGYAGRLLARQELGFPEGGEVDELSRVISALITYPVKWKLRRFSRELEERGLSTRPLEELLKDLSAIQMRLFKPALEPYDEELLFRELFDRLGVEPELSVSGERVLADVELLRLLFESLLRAIEGFTGGLPPVKVSSTKVGDRVLVEVDVETERDFSTVEGLFSYERALVDYRNFYVPQQVARVLGGELQVGHNGSPLVKVFLPFTVEESSLLR